MKKITMALAASLIAMSATAATEVDNPVDWFAKGETHGNIKYYYIQTDKKDGTTLDSSAHANSIGGKLGYTTAKLYGFTMGATFMTTNPFALPDNVDTSIIGRDNAVQLGLNPGDPVAQKGFSVLGEAYLDYQFQGLDAWYGRRVEKTPLINPKEVRMIPSSIEGGDVSYSFENGLKLGAGYLDKFKQRTSSEFHNMVKHALGDQAIAITGADRGSVIPAYLEWRDAHHTVRLYNYFTQDFVNSTYFDATHKHQVNDDFTWFAGIQGMHQHGIGHAKSATFQANLVEKDPVTGDPLKTTASADINARFFGLKAGATYAESSFLLAYTNVLGSRENEHNSLTLPWDGTPLFTDMITSNDLFTSNYGQGMTSSGGYIAGTSGIKAGYTQKYDFTGVKGFKSVLSYAYYDNKNFLNAQQDINLVLAYGISDFSLALKGIWVSNNTGNTAADTDVKAGETGASISQIDKLTQYRVIANWKF